MMNHVEKALAAFAASMALMCLLLTGCSSGSAAPSTQAPEPPATQAVTEEAAAQPPAETYEDNFSVDADAAKAFAEKIQQAVAAKDLEALADCTAFPVYVGLEQAGVVESREDFLALGADAVITDALMQSIQDADLSSFKPSMAGFSIGGQGTANINFGVSGGVLAITGINY